MTTTKTETGTAQHTPGPWNTTKHSTLPCFPQWGVYAEGSRSDLAIVKGDSQENGYSNARLISAAPELLEALRELADVLEGKAGLPYTKVAKARAAIAKAEGR